MKRRTQGIIVGVGTFLSIAALGALLGIATHISFPTYPVFNAPQCDVEAAPSIVVSDTWNDTVGQIAQKLQAAGWVSISSDSRGGVVSADCHKSKEWT